MKAFLDSSVLLKLYHKETDSPKIEQFVEERTPDLYLSEIAILEFRSAIWRKMRMGEIHMKIAIAAIGCFEGDSSQYFWIKVNSMLVASASKLLRRCSKIK